MAQALHIVYQKRDGSLITAKQYVACEYLALCIQKALDGIMTSWRPLKPGERVVLPPYRHPDIIAKFRIIVKT